MERYRVKPNQRVKLKDWDPDDRGSFEGKAGEEDSQQVLKSRVKKISKLQARLFAESRQSLLIVLQALDTGGKDSTIRHVFSDINPQGCRVSAFKKPTELELSHHFLWRVFQKVPPKGLIGIFNRSHYEDVLVTRVHDIVSDKDAKRRFEEIRDFEKSLSDSGTKILKFYLHISKSEQKKRLQDRLDDPEKHWKFNPDDLKERKQWDRYQDCYEQALAATSTQECPWYVVPANQKWFRNYLIAEVVYDTLKQMDPQFPAVPKGIDFSKIKID